MGNFFSLTASDDLISSSLISSHLVHRHTLSTCYDPIFDVSLSSKSNSVLVSDDGRLKLFNVDLVHGGQLLETTVISTKTSIADQIQDIVWSTELDRFLVLTSKRLATWNNDDGEGKLTTVELGLTRGGPSLWRMACWSSHLIVNLGLGTSIRHHTLVSSSSFLPLINSWSRSSLGYADSDLLSSMALSPQLILAINVELTNNRHVIDLLSFSDPSSPHHLKRIDTNDPCALDVITSLRNCTWLCKSHWPSDDCLCIIESDGRVKKVQQQQQQGGYILNARLLVDRSHFVIVRTPNKLPSEIAISETINIPQDEQQMPVVNGGRRRIPGKMPDNLVLEVYKIPMK